LSDYQLELRSMELDSYPGIYWFKFLFDGSNLWTTRRRHRWLHANSGELGDCAQPPLFGSGWDRTRDLL